MHVSTECRARWPFSLRMKLLVVLVPLLVVSMAVALLGLGRFLEGFFQRTAESETARLGQVVKSALRQQMLRKPDLVLEETLADLGKTQGLRRIWVIDKNGRIAHASDQAQIGRVLDKGREAICTVCHTDSVVPEPQTFFTRDESGIPILRHVNPIANERVCWGCHDPKIRLTGILLLEESTQPFQEALGTIRTRLAATGGITLAVLIVMITLITTALVDRPVRRLMAAVRRLGAGDLTARVLVRGRGELAELASAFNVMAEDLGRNLDEVRNKNAELSVVYSIVERLTKTINLGELKGIILETLLEVLRADRVLLMSRLMKREPGEILIKIKTSEVARPERLEYDEQGEVTLPEGFPSEIATRWLRGELREPLVTPDGQVAVVPVQVRGRSLALLLVRREQPFEHPEANPKLLTALADHIAVAFENARLYTLAITDELTQLFTVRHFHGRIEDEVSRYQRYGQKVGLLMLDLDHFKAINDRWGHPIGDQVLREVARVLRRSIRTVDSAYRYGGEEFAILLPEADRAAARVVAERVRRGVEALEVPLNGGGSIRVTASIGIGLCPQDGTSVQELVVAADAALYEAKRTGRNRVCDPPKTEDLASPPRVPGSETGPASPGAPRHV